MGSKGHRRLVSRARHSPAGRHRRYHPDFAYARARRRSHAGSSGRAGIAADHGLPHLRAAGCGMPRLRPYHLDHVPGTGALDPGFYTRRNAELEDPAIPASNRSTSRSWAASSTAPANPSTRYRHLAPRHRRDSSGACVRGRQEIPHLARPNIATEFKAMVIDYIDQRYGAGSAVPTNTVTAAE